MTGFSKADITPHIGTLSKFLKKASNDAKCDPDCQKKRVREKKRSEYINAQNNIKNAPDRLKQAEKDWFIYDKGERYYTEYKEKQYKQEAKTIMDSYLKNHIKPIIDKVDNQLQYYRTQTIYKNNVDSVYDSYNDNLKKLKTKVVSTKDEKSVNDRLAYFYNNNSDTTKWAMYYPKILYWIFVGTIIFLMIYKKTYRKMEYYPFILLILCGPFLIPKIYTLLMNNSKHFIIDNIFFIIVIFISLVALIFSKLSKLPFSYSPVN